MILLKKKPTRTHTARDCRISRHGSVPVLSCGGTGVLAFVPLTYGTHALQIAIFYSSSDQLGLDVAVLTASAIVSVVLGIFAVRRGIAS